MNVPTHKNRRDSGGFTIVELLIVIVVIGILAAITLVAFNGVSIRAEETVLKSDLQQTNKKLAASMVLSETTPSTLTDEDGNRITASDGTILQYTAYTTGPAAGTYCISASRNGIDYMLNSTVGQPMSGVCSDHTSINDMEEVVNLSPNPSVEVNATNWTDSRTECTRDESAAREGSFGMACVVDDSGYFPRVVGTTVPASPGMTFTMSAWIRSDSQVRIGYDRNNGGFQVLGPLVDSNGDWVRVSITSAVMPTGTNAIKPWIGIENNAANGTTFDVDGVMITEGSSQYDYADGDSSGWRWNGTPGLSSSTGLLAP